jgi:energy-coupling factor transporter transmembrane protein EcfT
MMGTIRLNFIIAAISFIVTFIVSSLTNIWLTTLIRSCYSFIILFIVVFLLRWVLGTFAGFNNIAVNDNELDENKGTALDVTTPDEDAALNQMLKDALDPNSPEAEPGFTPLNPPKLSSKVNLEPDELAQALRHMSEE